MRRKGWGEENQDKVDLDRLARAVAIAETSNCTKGTGISKNNCHGIMSWTTTGKRYPRTFRTTVESYQEFKRIWGKYYKLFPTHELAVKWTGDERAKEWLDIVIKNY